MLTQLENIDGCIEGLFGDLLYGWVIDRSQPQQHFAVELYIDGNWVDLVRADRRLPKRVDDPVLMLHGFQFRLKSEWLGVAQIAAVRLANGGPWLGEWVLNEPEKAIQLFKQRSENQQSLLTSHVYHTGGLKIEGWVIDPKDPDWHVEVIVKEKDALISRQKANKYHPALVQRQSADHGFSLTLPWHFADGKVHELTVEDALGNALMGSPVVMCHRPEGLEAILRHHWPGHQNTPAFQLLTLLAQEQDRRAPKSLPFNSYPRWYEMMAKHLQKRSTPYNKALGVLILDEDSRADQIQQTRASVDKQLCKRIYWEHTDSANAKRALSSLLEQGAKTLLVLPAGDRLAQGGLARLLSALDRTTSPSCPAWIYGDADQDGRDHQRTNPWFKPVWDLDLFLQVDLFTPGAVFDAQAIKLALDLSAGEDWYSLASAIALLTQQQRIQAQHLPWVTLHRDASSSISPLGIVPSESRLNAIQWLSSCLDSKAEVAAHPEYSGVMRVLWSLPDNLPKVSLIIPTRDQYELLYRCIESIVKYTRYPNIEIIVMDNDSRCPKTLAYLETLPARGIQVVPYPHPFNYSAINNAAVALAKGELVGLINNDIEVPETEGDWLTEMVRQQLRPGVGAVGVKLRWENGMVQHGGVVIGINQLAAHTGNHWLVSDEGYLGVNQLVKQQSAVTAACLLTPKALFESLGGLDEKAFVVTFNDVDYCLRLREKGYSLIWTPYAQLIHAESASRGKDHDGSRAARAQREQELMMSRWIRDWPGDPYYHPALTHDYASGPYGGIKSGLYEPTPRSAYTFVKTAD